MRIALEAVAIRITVPTLTPDDFAELEACTARMEHYQKAGDAVGMSAPHRAFHSRLVSGTDPPPSTGTSTARDVGTGVSLRPRSGRLHRLPTSVSSDATVVVIASAPFCGVAVGAAASQVRPLVRRPGL
jgi:hypothetical protein